MIRAPEVSVPLPKPEAPQVALTKTSSRGDITEQFRKFNQLQQAGSYAGQAGLASQWQGALNPQQQSLVSNIGSSGLHQPSGLTVTCNTANSQAQYGNVAQVLSTTIR